MKTTLQILIANSREQTKESAKTQLFWNALESSAGEISLTALFESGTPKLPSLLKSSHRAKSRNM
jgi:hypothetical protein